METSQAKGLAFITQIDTWQTTNLTPKGPQGHQVASATRFLAVSHWNTENGHSRQRGNGGGTKSNGQIIIINKKKAHFPTLICSVST